MRLIDVVVPYASRSDTYRLWHLTDLHLGAGSVDEALLKKHIKQILDDPHALWIGGGDYIDAISRKGDKRYQESTLAGWLHGKDDPIQLQIERVVDLLSPIASKCVGLVSGNHEAALLQHNDRDAYRVIVNAIAKAGEKRPEALALGINGFVRLSFRRTATSGHTGNQWLLTIYAHHGAGGGRAAGGDALFLERMLSSYDADLVLVGHRHRAMVVTRSSTSVGKTEVRVVSRTAMMSASYMRSYHDGEWPVDTYAENKALPPTQVGAVPVIIDPDARQFYVMLASGGAGAGERYPSIVG